MISAVAAVASAAAPASAGATHASGDAYVASLLAVLVAVFLATRILGAIARRFGQPAVLGELVAGVLLGGSVLGVLDPTDPVIYAMAQVGVVVLLFETGIHTDLGELLKVGWVAAVVAITGVVVPLVLGFAAVREFGLATAPALVCGAALCATSVGISARVLSELGYLDTVEGRVVLGAAVIDDIIGLIILSVVAAIVGGESISIAHIGVSTGVAVAFVVLAVVLGGLFAPRALAFVARAPSEGTLGLIALSFAFMLAWLAELSGSAMIVGAFAAGVVLDDTPARREIERATSTLGTFFVPVFFASVAARVDLHALIEPRALAVGGILIATGIVGKVAAGFAPFWFPGRKLLVGVAMVPRGEVGLIFAQLGVVSGAIDAGLFGAIMLMVLATTFVTPPALSRIVNRRPRRQRRRGSDAVVGDDGGLEDLVSGAGPTGDSGEGQGGGREETDIV
jgi:Kef-type K+ transport system membrane component KefB